MSLPAPLDQDGQAALATWGERAAALAGLEQVLKAHAAAFSVDACDDYLDIACREPVRGRRNRCRLRITRLHDDELSIIFYRSGLEPDGTGFSYGGLSARGPRLRPDQVQGWLGFLVGGFSPSSTPRGLQSEFQYPVPDVREAG